MPNIKTIFKSTSIFRILISITLFLGINIIIRWISSDAESTLSTFTFIQRTVMASIVRPLIFLLSHVVYFGPIIFIILFNWGSINDVIDNFGLGLYVYIFLNLFLSLNSESRTIIAAFPVFGILSIEAMKNKKFSFWFYWSFIIVSFIFSKIWLPLGNVIFDGGYYRLPYQWYFMNYGPWISNQMYIIQGVITLVCGLTIFLLINRDGKKVLD